MAKAKNTTISATSSEVPAGPSQLKIQGLLFPFVSRYAAGHVLTAEEALVLDQTLAENLRNNFASKIRAKSEEIAKATPEGEAPRSFTEEERTALQNEFQAYASSYVFRAPRAGSGPVDPIERTARKMAKELVMTALAAKNIKHTSLPEGKMEEFITAVLSRKPEIMDEAQRRVEAAKAGAADLLDAIG